MSICSRVKGFSRTHEHIADAFSLVAVVLFLATIWGGIQYQALILDWIRVNLVLHLPLVVLGIILDVVLIFMFLSVGAARFSEDGEDEACFRTFRGRRHGGVSLGTAFHTWLDHIEHVNKKHR